jgi:hypothetical protein
MSAITQGFTIGAAEEIRSFVKLLGQIAGSVQAALRCRDEIERLSQLSDAQLAARGLRRDGIVRYAFENHFPE